MRDHSRRAHSHARLARSSHRSEKPLENGGFLDLTNLLGRAGIIGHISQLRLRYDFLGIFTEITL